MTDIADIAARLPSGSPLDPAALKKVLDLDPTGANRLFGRLVDACEALVSRLLPQLEAAMAGGDLDTVRSVAHTLKSSMANLGALQLSALCAEVERTVRSGEHAGLPELVDRLRADIRSVSESLRSLVTALG